jgi:sortase A
MSLTFIGRAAPVPPPPPRQRGARVRAGVRTLGELMITVGLVLLLFSAYEIWGKALIVSGHQKDLDAQLTQQWGTPGTTPAPTAAATTAPPVPQKPPANGSTVARLYVPRMGKHWVVVEGVRTSNLAYAPGHYPDTALPGQIGNFSVAGHRSPAIFWDLDKVAVDDVIVVETKDNWFVYVVTQNLIVAPTAVEVVAPFPGSPGKPPEDEMLTLTTCNPKWDNYQRMIVHAKLDKKRTLAHADGPPAGLGL